VYATRRRRRLPLIRAAVVAAAIMLLSISSVSAQDTGAEAPGKAAAGPPAGANQPKPGFFKELHIRNVEIRGALEMLNSQVKKNIVTTKEVTGNVTADLYGVTFKEALEGILRANGLAYTEQGNFIFVMTSEQKAELTKVERKTSVQMFRLSYVNAADMRTLLTPLLSEVGTIAITPAAQQGITTSSTEAGGSSYATADVLIVRDYDDNLRRIATVVQELDVKPDQVLIEATLLRARLTENNALGIDFNVLGGVDFNGLGTTTNGLQSHTVAAANPVIPDTDVASFRTDFNAAIPAGGLTFGFMSDKVGVFVRALEGITDINVMANPKLLIVNKQRGEVMVGNKDGYLTTTFTETTASQTVEFLETGTKLVVRPFIGREDHVRLEIHPEDSSGAVAQVGTAALPSETTTEVTSNVLVRDGHTIVIGGLFREETNAGRAQTPLIGNIPYVGALFRRTIDVTNREEVIILVTPRIIRQAADEGVSEQLRDDVERFRIGARKGLRWWGRSRLAQCQIRYARCAMAKGNRDKALWHIDAALSLRPNLIEAIRLKERLTSRTYWADAARQSSARFIIHRMIMNDLGKPVERVIPRRKPLNGEGLGEDVKKAFGIIPRIEDPLELAPPPVVDDDDDDDDDDDAAITPDGSEIEAVAADDAEAPDQPDPADAEAGDQPAPAVADEAPVPADEADAPVDEDADQGDPAVADDPGSEDGQSAEDDPGEDQEPEVGMGESSVPEEDLAADDTADNEP